MIKKHDKLYAGGLLLILGAMIFTQVPSIRVTVIASDTRLMPIVGVPLCCFGLPLFVQGLLAFRKNNQIAALVEKRRFCGFCSAWPTLPCLPFCCRGWA